MPHKTHVVFDIDGTLIDTARTGLLSLQQTIYQELGRQVPMAELIPYFGIPSHEAILRLGFPDPKDAALKWEEKFQELMNLASPFDGVDDLLHQLHQKGIVLGVVTSRSHAEFEADPNLHAWASLFTCVVCAEDTHHHKPNPDPMLYFLDKTGATPKHTLFVGDTIYDQQCADWAGVDFALALWGASDPTVPCQYKPAHPNDLAKLLL